MDLPGYGGKLDSPGQSKLILTIKEEGTAAGEFKMDSGINNNIRNEKYGFWNGLVWVLN